MAPAGYGDSVEGIHAVRAAFEAGRVERATVERGRHQRGDLATLVGDLHDRAIPVQLVDDVRPLSATSAPQGIVASCRPLEFRDVDELVEAHSPASLLVVDHIEDTHNLGAIARSAVAAGVPRLVVPVRRSAPLSAAAFKAAAGALEHCAIAVVSSIADAIRRLGQMGVWVVALDAGGTSPLFGLDILSEPVAVVIGGETGLARLVRQRADVVASIPIDPAVESLNASVAAALACFEIGRARGR